MFAKIFLFFIAAFAVIVVYLSFVNNFSSEIEGILLKAIGAVAIGFYFLANSFIINPKPGKEVRVRVPMAYERNSGTVVAPYSRNSGSRPEESAMFSGLSELNTLRLYNAFYGMPIWQKLKTHSNEDNNELERLEILEFIFFQWMGREANWLTVNQVKSFSDNGWGGGANVMTKTEDNSSEISLEHVSLPNRFVQKYPLTIVLPTGASLERESNKHSISIDIKTDTGNLSFRFTSGMGGIFQKKAASVLSRALDIQMQHQFQGIVVQDIWLDYPEIYIKYTPFKKSQFSMQSNREAEWVSKIEKNLYKDFSWDLLREHYSVDFQAALNLFRSKYGEIN